MIDLTPPLSVTAAPLARPCGGIRRAIARIGRMGFAAVQLSAAQKGLRPRELDRRARRDVQATLARQGLTLSGLDLMIPHEDWIAADKQDGAVHAAIAALDLAADLGKVPLSMTLPVEKLPAEITHALLAAADARGVTIAAHAEHDVEALRSWLTEQDQPILRAGLDPAALLATGHDPSDVAVGLTEQLCVARLDDHAPTSVTSAGGRCPVGTGQLDVAGYRGALSACQALRSIVIELRDLSDPLDALQRAGGQWGLDVGLGPVQ